MNQLHIYVDSRICNKTEKNVRATWPQTYFLPKWSSSHTIVISYQKYKTWLLRLVKCTSISAFYRISNPICNWSKYACQNVRYSPFFGKIINGWKFMQGIVGTIGIISHNHQYCTYRNRQEHAFSPLNHY